MKGDPKVLDCLEQAATFEAHLVLQYKLDARSLKDMGLKKLAKCAKKWRKQPDSFLKQITDRILFLEGSPEYDGGKVADHTTVTELLQDELALEVAIIEPYEKFVVVCQQELDDTSRNLFEHALKAHEYNIEDIERELSLIKKVGGEAAYIAARI
jgi:bacterioferritin